MALFYLLLLVFLCTCNVQAADPIFHYCNDNITEINTREVSANIDNLLAELVSNINPQDGFKIASVQGKDGDRVYGLAQCLGDLMSNQDICLSCIKDASMEIRKRCSYQTDAKIWYDNCFLRYDTREFYGQLDTSIGFVYAKYIGNVKNPVTFNKRLGTLMDEIRSEAVMPGKKSFAVRDIKLSPFSDLYAFVQCTMDLSQLSCSKCLAKAISQIPSAYSYSVGCQVLYSTCFVHYDIILMPRSTRGSFSPKTDHLIPMVFRP